jgi:hypothetical protein
MSPRLATLWSPMYGVEGVRLVMVQDVPGGSQEWHLSTDLVVALGLQREGMRAERRANVRPRTSRA